MSKVKESLADYLNAALGGFVAQVEQPSSPGQPSDEQLAPETPHEASLREELQAMLDAA